MNATGAGCSNPLHDHPLPKGYIAASVEAGRRLRQGWKNRCCHACGFYGWLPPTRPAEPKVADDE